MREANRRNLGFLGGQALTSASGSLKTLLANSPTPSAAIELKEKWDEVTAAREKIQSAAQVMRELKTCLDTPGCRPMDVVSKVAADVRAWAESTLKANASAASARVEEARDLLQNYAERSLNVSTGTLKAMAECTTRFTEQAQAASQAPPVTTPQAAAPKSGGKGKGVAIIVGGIAAAVGGAYAYSEMKEAESIFDSFNTPTTSTGGPTTPAPATGVRRFDGVYDFAIIIPNFSGDSTTRSPAGFSINNGTVTTANRDLSGTVSDAGTFGNFTGVGACPVNNDVADYTGRIETSGTGSGSYRCRTGGISRTWTISNRR